jgi:hypothetical protein
LPGEPIFRPSGFAVDIDKFIYIGSTETGNPYVFFTRRAAGLDSLDKVRNTAACGSAPTRSAIRCT